MRDLVLCDDCNPEFVLPLCKKFNAGIEIQGFHKPGSEDIKEEILERYLSTLPKEIKKYFHAPFADLCLGSSNQKIVDVTKFYFDYAYEMAMRLGCERITVHHGYVPKTSCIPNWIKRSVAFWNDYLNDKKISFDMENVLELDETIQKAILDEVGSDKLGINLDIGHAYCNSSQSVKDWIKNLGERITYVHLHDNHGKSDEHLGLGKGNMALMEVLNALNEYAPNAILALECRLEDMEESLLYLKENKII